MNERDTKVYREKDMKHTCIKTIMGTVEIDRRIYEYRTEDGEKAYKYLMDEFSHMDATGHMLENPVENIVDNISEISYRKTNSNVELMTNQHISHTAVWNVVQNVGTYIKEREKIKIELNKRGRLNGKKELKVLFQEQDGIWLNMQGKDRPEKAKSKKRELKLEVSYEG